MWHRCWLWWEMVVVCGDDDKVDRSGGSRQCDVVEMTTREMVMRVACGCHGDKGGGGEGGGGGCRGVWLGALGSWPKNGAGAGNLKCVCTRVIMRENPK
ncbi:hypothetical protein Tco_0492058 [Tanacetum coccineum]